MTETFGKPKPMPPGYLRELERAAAEQRRRLGIDAPEILERHMRITVTQEDIDDGKRQDPFCCPIALATKRDTSMDVSVTRSDLQLYRNSSRTLWRALMPPDATTFTDDFDAGRPVMPFSFEAHFMDLRR